MRKLVIGLLALIAVAGAAYLYGRWLFYGSAVEEPHHLYIYRSTDYATVADSVRSMIRHPKAFDFYARRLDLEHTFKPGHYLLTPGQSVITVTRTLKLGLQTPVDVTINNVKIPAHLAGKLARQFEADSVAFLAALTSRELASEVGFDSLTLFSMFLPDTYEFYWTATPEEVVRRLRKEYDRFWTPERDKARERSGLSRLEVMTLASIVYEETRKSDEMPRVAGVYINRLKKGIPLQADPTIKYAMQDFTLRRILKSYLKTPSPYNTYINKGLPPSPICMPGRDAIEAVLHFEQHQYLYFCARATFDGYHNFAKTYTEHLVNARAYATELNRRKIMK